MTVLLESKQDAIDFRNDFSDKVDDLLDTALDDSFVGLMAAKAAVVQDIKKRVAQLPSVLVYQPADTIPALVVAHDLYYDATRDQEVIDRNKTVHPGFVPGGGDVEYLR